MKKTLLALMAVPVSLMAQVAWNGAGDGTTYTNDANWVGGIAPTDDLTTDMAQLTGGTVDLTVDRSVSGLDINAASTLTGSGTRLTLGSDGLTGAGDLTLDGGVILRTGTIPASKATGAITIDGSTVEVTTGTQGFLGTGTITLDNGGMISGQGSHVNMRDTTSIVLGAGGGTLANANARALYGLENAVISGAGQLTLDGNGSINYPGNSRIQLQGGANTYTGGTLIHNKANVQVNADANFGAVSGKVTIDDARMVTDANVTFDGSREFEIASGGGRISLNNKTSTINGIISGTGALTIDGQIRDDDGNSPGGTLWLENAGTTHSGGITIKDVTVMAGLQSAGFLGTGTVTLDNGTIEGGAGHMTLAGIAGIVLTENGGTLRHDAGRAVYGLDNVVISGAGQLTLSGPGSGSTGGNNRLQMTGANTYTGGTLLTDNVNAIIYGGSSTGNGTLGAADTKITFDNGRLMDNDGGLNLGTREIAMADGGGRISLNDRTTTIGGVISGTGDLLIDGQNRNINDSTPSGTLQITSANNTLTGAVTIDENATVRMSANNALGTGAVTIDGGSQLMNLDSHTALDNDITIGAGGAELKAGWNKSLTLDGALSGSGGLTVVADSGTVYLNGDSSGFTGLLDVESGAKLGGSGSVNGDLTIAAGGTLMFSTTDTLTVGGTVTLDSTFGIDDLIGIDSSSANGTFTLIDGDVSQSFIDGFENIGLGNAYDLGDGKSAYFQEGSLQVTVIPEPATIGMIAAFGAGMLFIRRRFMI